MEQQLPVGPARPLRRLPQVGHRGLVEEAVKIRADPLHLLVHGLLVHRWSLRRIHAADQYVLIATVSSLQVSAL